MATVDLQAVAALVGREAAEVTRRDVARALLAVPADDAVASLPALRRESLAAGRPLSAAFWDRTEALLTTISRGTATVGDVHRWLEATGSEPIRLVAGGFLWPEEDERGPVAEEMHARLVAHLEELVAAGDVDPDRLLAEEPAAWTAYEQAQVDWLYTPLADGRQPIWAVSDEEDEEFLAAWDDAEAGARQVLAELLDEQGPRPCPEAALHAAAARLRETLRDGSWPYDLLRAAGDVDASALPDDDHELWLALAAGVVTGGAVSPWDGYLDDESHMAWMSLDHAAWIAAVVTLVRLGPAAPADGDALARYAATFDFEEDAAEGEPAGDDADVDEPDTLGVDRPFLVDGSDAELALSLGFDTVVLLWRLLGAVDADERLTELGWWGLPEALHQAWRPRSD